MKVAFAVQADEGIKSKVFNHFGSAPVFVIADAVTGEVTSVNNQDMHHVHGACNPIKAIDGRKVDAVVVGGIGAGRAVQAERDGHPRLRLGCRHGCRKPRPAQLGHLRELMAMHACAGHEGGCNH